MDIQQCATVRAFIVQTPGNMPRIFIRNLGKILEVGETTRNLLAILQEHHIDWMHACGGKGRCTTCKTIVVDGLNNFEVTSAAEKRYHEIGALALNERLMCQARISGDIVICVPEECKLPHLTYLD